MWKIGDKVLIGDAYARMGGYQGIVGLQGIITDFTMNHLRAVVDVTHEGPRNPYVLSWHVRTADLKPVVTDNESALRLLSSKDPY